MFGLFKKKEPEKAFGEFKERKQCVACSRLQKPFAGDFLGGCCPDCGSFDVKIVAARWEESVISRGFVAERVLYRSEIKTSDAQ